jgi:YVTN family beta-propeller protein
MLLAVALACNFVSLRPSGAASRSPAPLAYVTTVAQPLPAPGALAIIDTVSETVLATVPAAHYSFSVALTPDGRFAYISDNSFGKVVVVDTLARSVVATVAVGSGLIAISPDGRRAYVMAPRPPIEGVAVIDTATNSVITGIPVAQGKGALAIAPDGVIYVADSTDNTIQVVDPITNAVTRQIPLDGPPGNIAIRADGQKAYVALPNASDGSGVAVLDLRANSVVDTIEVPYSPGAIALTPDGSRAYIMNRYGSVMDLDLVTNSVTSTIPLPPLPYGRGAGIATSPDGRFVYAVSYSDFVVDTPPLGNVSVIDVATDTISTTISMDARAFAIAISQPPTPPDATATAIAIAAATPSVTLTAAPTLTATETPTTAVTPIATPSAVGEGGCSVLGQRDRHCGLWNHLVMVAVLFWGCGRCGRRSARGTPLPSRGESATDAPRIPPAGRCGQERMFASIAHGRG